MAGDIVFRPGTPHLPAMRTGTAARTAIGVLAAAVIPLTGRAQLIQPSDLEYRGAFRLPGPGGAGEATWAWGGHGLAYHPGGDPLGPEDGYPGSLFGLGHDHHQYVSEIGIPEPVISGGKDLADLNTATTLQPFANIRGNLYAGAEPFEIPYAGLEYLPAGSGRTVERLYFGWHQHLQIASSYPTHGWCSLNLAAPNPVGPWYIGNYDTYGTTDYLFAIPQGWADAHAGGRCLATGRMRDGGQGGQGPSIYAIGPWLDGDPPPANARLSAIPLLRYHNVYYGDPYSGPRAMDRYHHSDQWAGAAWLTAGGSGAVIFVGTKGRGDCWYGGPNGEPPPCENQGWWSTYFDGEIIFYDPAELATAAVGEMIVEIARALAVPVSPQAATCLLASIVEDTGCFQFSRVSALSLRICAELVAAGADLHSVVQQLYWRNPEGAARLRGACLTRMRTQCGGRLAWTAASTTDFDQFGATEEDADEVVHDMLRIGTVEVAVLLRESAKDYRVSLRSRDSVDVASLAREFGGGGHERAGGCRIGKGEADVAALIAAAAQRLEKPGNTPGVP